MTTEKSLPEAASVWDWDQIAGRLRAIADRAARWSHRYPSLEFDNPAVLNIEEIVSETTVKWISAEATEAWLEAGDRQFTFAVRLRTSACIGKLIFWAVLDPLSSENSISGLVVGRSHRSQVVGKSVRSQGLTPRTGLLCIVATADLTMAADPDLLSLLVKGFFEAATDLDRDAWISWLWGQANRGNLIPSFVRRLGGRILRRAGRQATVSEPATDCVDMAHLLKRAGVFERGFDYVLPSGLHAEVHVNLGTACGNLPVVRRLAHGVKELLDGSDYDTIVSTGWPTATIAREVIRLRPLTRLGVVRHTQCEGIPPIPMSPPAEGSRAVILTDVILTGALVEQTSAVVKRAGALVVDIVTIVDATCSSIQGKDLTFRAICKYDIGAVDSRSCPRCEDGLKRREFNPVACCMTSKKTRPRSPGEFLKENREAADFWKQVDTARAYEHHRIDGNTHFISFIDTERLLAHETVGPMILSKLVAKNPRLIERSDVLLIPGKARARNLASKLARMLASGGRLWLPQIIVARQINGRIQLTADDSRGLRNAKVLIVDTGVSSGATLEGLHNLAVAAGATVVSAAVIISRLSESHEAAISARLEGRFWRLYNLPIRPLAIPDGLRDLCPVCCRRKQIIDAASDSRLRPLVQLSREIRSRKRYRIVASRPKFARRREVQLNLIAQSEAPFLARCRRSVASGVTLHSLCAAGNNGMAPLRLPEICDASIPVANRAAMLEHLESSAWKWSSDALSPDTKRLLREQDPDEVWTACVTFLNRTSIEGEHRVRSSYRVWVEALQSRLESCDSARQQQSKPVWNRIAHEVYQLLKSEPSAWHELRRRFEDMRRTCSGTPAEVGMTSILEVINKPGSRPTA